ncbi:GlcNAc-PI de-N-acetylase [Lacunisphaera limnophila]|uniref:GlcNAc-PI de-N-acetylase n=1 Tax=Lacunisphaera limnophila TaxID=1838286 RepID=A0A1D8AWD2_9BACT|nr:PIG-L family deacetylase [Lacunisphaera limnophila]AOS45204.1 GlcNAc-PI de-N-acetylase [Lacunisphaera limnophila]
MSHSPLGLRLVLAGLCSGLLAVSLVAQRPHFAPQGDYAYDLGATETNGRTVQLDATGFDWPADLAPADTVFLEISLTASPGQNPGLKAVRGALAVRQVFEAETRGRRFLDVSPLVKAEGGRVALTGTGLTWSPGPARLFTYRNAPLAGRRVLVLAPHPDDAEIAAFGVYRQTQADVITVTSGDAGGDNFKVLFTEPAEHYRVKGWIRTWDSISVPFYGGVYPGKARNLGYYDATLKRLQAAPAAVVPPLLAALEDPGYYRKLNVDPALRDRPFHGTWEALVNDLVWELERVRPEVIVAPHPLLDNHADHQFTTIALIDALARWPGACELYLYTNHALENEAWPLGDRDAMSGLPPTSHGGLFFRRLYSHPLSPFEQKLKLVALEGMHDLRAFDLRDGTPVSESDREAWADYDYYRRGPRPNELYFVVTREEAFRLRDAFLAPR